MVIIKPFKYEEVLGIKFGYKLIGKPKMSSHVYFVDGLLIDTGHSRMRNWIIAETSKLSVNQLLVTHHHEDHTGNLQPLKELFKCKVYASEKCCQLMKNPPRLSFIQQLTWGTRGSFHTLIPVNDVITTNKYSFTIIPIPGHAPDMVALYEPTRQWLFSADLFINSYIGYFIRDESITKQIESIKKVLQLDFKVMFCSHNPQLKNPRQKLTNKLTFLESFYDNVASLYSKGYSAKEVFNNLQLEEKWLLRTLSNGYLSKMNMVKSVIRDIES